MKHFFFINPVAGQGGSTNQLEAEIKKTFEKNPDEYEIVFTNSKGDAEIQARRIAEALEGEEARFFACGGDGTANEVLNGMVGFENIALGIVPIGTGNDTIRNFFHMTNSADFMNIKAQKNGVLKAMDAIRYSGKINGKYSSKHCLNMFNIGLDCDVSNLAGKLKQKPFIAGSLAYLLAVFGKIIRKKGIKLNISEGDNILYSGKLLLCAISNGSYCGGGIKSSPQAIVDDGIMDLNIIKNVSRMQFINLFPKYKKGTHLSLKGIEKVIEVKAVKELNLTPVDEDEFVMCVDGDSMSTTGIKVEICKHKFKFIVPQMI